jgi:hypothetical protein
MDTAYAIALSQDGHCIKVAVKASNHCYQIIEISVNACTGSKLLINVLNDEGMGQYLYAHRSCVLVNVT